MQRFDPRIYLFAGGHFATDWAQSAIPALLPYFISVCNLSYQDAGTLIFGNILLASICQPILGYYADKVSKPWLAPIGPVISGLSIAIMPFTTNFWVIFLCSMFSGFGSALYHPEAARMVNGLAGDQKGKALGTFSVGGNAGFAIGPMFAGFCAYIFDVHGLVFFGIFNCLLALVLYRQLPGIQADIRHEQIAEAKAHPDRVLTNDWVAFGKLTFVSYCAQRFDDNASNPYTPAAYSWPSTFTKEQEDYLTSEIQRLITLLGMKTSVYNIETRIGQNGNQPFARIFNDPAFCHADCITAKSHCHGQRLFSAGFAACAAAVQIERKPRQESGVLQQCEQREKDCHWRQHD